MSGEDTIGVFGSSHSSVLVLRNLLENPAVSLKKVINLYRSYLPDGRIKDDNTRLKVSD